MQRLLVEKLTEVCTETLAKEQGFEWITHTVDYRNVASSLNIICVFDRAATMQRAQCSAGGAALRALIIKKLAEASITLHDSARQISFDNEEACAIQHQGNWQARLAAH